MHLGTFTTRHPPVIDNPGWDGARNNETVCYDSFSRFNVAA